MRTARHPLRTRAMRAGAALLLGALCGLVCWALAATAGAQDCTASPGARFSFDVSVSPRAGRMALYDVRVYARGACEPGALVGSTTLGSYRRLEITDTGVLVRLLAPRTSHHDWNILSLVVVARAGSPERVRWLSLDDLPGMGSLVGSVRASFDGSDVLFRGRSGEARVSFAALDALASTD